MHVSLHIPVHSPKACKSRLRQARAGQSNSMQVSHVNGRKLSIWTITCCLTGHAIQGNCNWRQGQDLKPGIPNQDGSIPEISLSLYRTPMQEEELTAKKELKSSLLTNVRILKSEMKLNPLKIVPIDIKRLNILQANRFLGKIQPFINKGNI